MEHPVDLSPPTPTLHTAGAGAGNYAGEDDHNYGDDYAGEEMLASSVAVLCGLYVVSTLVGICGSSLIVFTLLSDARFRHESATYVSYLTNVVVTDLFFQLYYFPLVAAGLLIGRYPVVNHAHCVVNGFLLFAGSIVFMLTLVAISVDRYVLVCHRHVHARYFSRRSSSAVCLVLWVASGLVCVPSTVDGTLGFDPKTHMCFLQHHLRAFTVGHGVTIGAVIVTVVAMAIPNALIYRAYLSARNRVAPAGREGLPNGGSQDVAVSGSDIALLRALLTVCLAFFLLTFPATLLFILRTSLYVSPFVYGLSIWLYAVNSSTNWVIYGLMNSRFRSGYARAVQRMKACLNRTG